MAALLAVSTRGNKDRSVVEVQKFNGIALGLGLGFGFARASVRVPLLRTSLCWNSTFRHHPATSAPTTR
jgi:hypothetical protein